jgi:hypothetical protein
MSSGIKLTGVTLDADGRMVLDDEFLKGLANDVMFTTAGGDGERNTQCSNFSSCNNSSNSGGCTNSSGQCGGSTNGFMQCRVTN